MMSENGMHRAARRYDAGGAHVTAKESMHEAYQGQADEHRAASLRPEGFKDV
jgi:hypothetical protein